MKNKKIVVAVCGSVAAVESPKLVRELRRKGLDVECVMSASAQNIIHKNVLEWASEKPVVTEITGKVEHVRLCGIDGEAPMLLICPATSNTISKIACGIDDTTVTTFAATALGSGKKVLIAPAMHYSMYDNPFVRDNIEKLKKHGVVFIGPRIQENKAKVAENDVVVTKVLAMLKT
jgi:phosphopantothenoylcysteine decarboxylase/phosphopantothenate--cysteine ligase